MDIMDLIRNHRKETDIESLNEYCEMLATLNDIDDRLSKEEKDVEVLDAVEEMYQKIKIGILKLADKLLPEISRVNKNISKKSNTMQKLLTNILKDTKEIKDKISSIDKDEFGEIKVTDILSHKGYLEQKTFTQSIFKEETSYPKVLFKNANNFTSDHMNKIIKLFKTHKLPIVENNKSTSGYTLTISKEYTEDFIEEEVVISNTGYSKKDINKCFINLEAMQKLLDKNHPIGILEKIKEEAKTIVTDFHTLRKKDNALTKAAIKKTTIQLCRCFFYTMLIDKFYSLPAWLPVHSDLNIIQAIKKYEIVEEQVEEENVEIKKEQ